LKDLPEQLLRLSDIYRRRIEVMVLLFLNRQKLQFP